MDEATQLCFWFPAVGRKKVTAAFDGGRITSDGGDKRLDGGFCARSMNGPERRAVLQEVSAITSFLKSLTGEQPQVVYPILPASATPRPEP